MGATCQQYEKDPHPHGLRIQVFEMIVWKHFIFQQPCEQGRVHVRARPAFPRVSINETDAVS